MTNSSRTYSCMQPEIEVLLEELNDLRSWVYWYVSQLHRAIQDFEYVLGSAPDSDGYYDIRLVVDFHEVYAYVFPFSELLEKYDSTDREFRDHLVQKHITRAYLFHAPFLHDKVYILSPHLKELNYSLLALTASSPAQFVLEDRAAFLQQDLVEAVGDLRNVSHQPQRIKEESVASLFRELWERYAPLLVFISCVQGDSAELLRDVSREHLAIPERDSPLAQAITSPDSIDYWKRLLLDIHGGKFKRASRRDAEALAQVEAANSNLANSKIIYYFVSDAPAMVSAVDKVGVERFLRLPEGSRVPVMRGLDYFLVCLRNAPPWQEAPQSPDERREFAEETLKRLRDEDAAVRFHVRATSRANHALKSCSRNCEICPLPKMAHSLQKTLAFLRDTRTELEQGELLLNSEPFLRQYSEKVLTGVHGFEENVLALLAESSFEARAEDFVAYLKGQIATELIGFSARVAAATGSRSLNREQIAVLATFPFGLDAGSTVLQHALREIGRTIRTLSRQKEPTAIRREFEKLVSSEFREQLDATERHLLEALVLFALGETRLTARLCQLAKENVTKRTRRHFEYLEDLSLLREHGTGPALTLVLQKCQQSMEAYPTDGRFAVLASYILICQYEHQKKRRSLTEAVKCVDVAISRRHKKWDRVKAALINNKAFALALQKGKHKEALQALERINVFKKDRKQWDSTWLHTLAFAHYRSALESTDAAARLQHATKAETYFGYAIDRCISPSRCKKLHHDMDQNHLLLGEKARRTN